MKCCLPLLFLALAPIPAICTAQSLVDGTNYPGLFGPVDDVTVTPPSATGAVVDIYLGGSASGALGTYWEAEANGGARVGTILGTIAQTGAQVELTGGALEFNISNDPGSVLGFLGVGTGLALDWTATATFDASGNQLLLAPDSSYQLSFDVDGSDGLLNSTLGITPTFGVELLDGAGNAIGYAGGGTLANIIGLELLGVIGAPPGEGRATVQFNTGSSVPAGAASVRFTGSALLPATVLGLGTQFASISNIEIAAVPEPSVPVLVGLVTVVFGFRRRRTPA